MDEPDLEARVRAIRKVELHQHVDGSIPPQVTWELMQKNRLHPVASFEEMRRRLERLVPTSASRIRRALRLAFAYRHRRNCVKTPVASRNAICRARIRPTSVSRTR